MRLEKNEYDVTPDIPAVFTDTNLSPQISIEEDKLTAFNTLKMVGFYDIKPKRWRRARKKDFTKNIPEA